MGYPGRDHQQEGGHFFETNEGAKRFSKKKSEDNLLNLSPMKIGVGGKSPPPVYPASFCGFYFNLVVNFS